MSSYVMAFRARPDRSSAPGEDEAWGAWFAQLGAAVVDPGLRVGNCRLLPAADAAPVSDGGPAEALTGYVVVTADDMDGATRLAAGCPGLRHQVSVEVAEVVQS